MKINVIILLINILLKNIIAITFFLLKKIKNQKLWIKLKKSFSFRNFIY